MRYRLEHPNFSDTSITIEKDSWYESPHLVVDGRRLTDELDEAQTVRNDHGEPMQVSLVRSGGLGALADPLPKVRVGGEEYSVDRPLAWYDQFFALLPIGLVAVGGALGGGLGAAGFVLNRRLFRSDLPTVAKYMGAACITGAAILVWVVLATAITLAL